MARGNPVKLDNGNEFATQGDATLFFRGILHSTTSKITEDHESYSDVMALYKRLPEFEEKSKNEENIQYFIVKNSNQYNKKCFHAVHNNGSETDWSYPTAIRSKGKTNFQCFTDGARYSLEQEIARFRDSDFTNKCRNFLKQCGFSEEDFPEDWVSKAKNSQYRATLLEPTKSNFVAWYKAL